MDKDAVMSLFTETMQERKSQLEWFYKQRAEMLSAFRNVITFAHENGFPITHAGNGIMYSEAGVSITLNFKEEERPYVVGTRQEEFGYATMEEAVKSFFEEISYTITNSDFIERLFADGNKTER